MRRTWTVRNTLEYYETYNTIAKKLDFEMHNKKLAKPHFDVCLCHKEALIFQPIVLDGR